MVLHTLTHAQTTDRHSLRTAASNAGRCSKNRHTRRAKHDLTIMSDHVQEVVGKGLWRTRGQGGVASENVI